MNYGATSSGVARVYPVWVEIDGLKYPACGGTTCFGNSLGDYRSD